MFTLSHKDIKEFQTLYGNTNPKPLSENEAEQEAQKLLSLVSLVINNSIQNHEN